MNIIPIQNRIYMSLFSNMYMVFCLGPPEENAVERTPVYIESNSISEETQFSLEGLRLINVKHFIDELIRIANHCPAMGCTLSNMQPIKESRHGLLSTIHFKCTMCNLVESVTTDNDICGNVNTNIVIGTLGAGTGYTQSSQILSAANIPPMPISVYKKEHKRVCRGWEIAAKESMRQAAEEERRLALDAGDVSVDGTPMITVICDGNWAKRSYRKNYNSLSGTACIIGQRTKKVLFLGVRNKYCSTCNTTTRNNRIAKKHDCSKNWDGASTAMEADIIAEGFASSFSEYGLIYKKMVGDGDSNCYKRLLEERPYQMETVEKIECKNHLLRNYNNKLRDLAKDTKIAQLSTRKALLGSISKLRLAIIIATRYRKSEDCSAEDKIENLKRDILNSPRHVFGCHINCAAYFCNKETVIDNTHSNIKDSNLYLRVVEHTRYLANHSKSVIVDVSSNDAEVFNSIVAKYIGGKRINYTKSGSYSARCYLAALSYNSNAPVCELQKRFMKVENIGVFTTKFS